LPNLALLAHGFRSALELGAVPARQHEMGAFSSEGLSDAQSDALARTRDNGHLA